MKSSSVTDSGENVAHDHSQCVPDSSDIIAFANTHPFTFHFDCILQLADMPHSKANIQSPQSASALASDLRYLSC